MEPIDQELREELKEEPGRARHELWQELKEEPRRDRGGTKRGVFPRSPRRIRGAMRAPREPDSPDCSWEPGGIQDELQDELEDEKEKSARSSRTISITN
jgi:hypothetical protein